MDNWDLDVCKLWLDDIGQEGQLSTTSVNYLIFTLRRYHNTFNAKGREQTDLFMCKIYFKVNHLNA